MEAAYFRYASNDAGSKSYANAKSFVLLAAILFSVIFILLSPQVAHWLDIDGYDQLIKYAAGIMALDAICELPFARLRLQNRPIKFVSIKIVNIITNVALNYFFLWWLPHQNHNVGDATTKISLVFLSNFIASIVTILLLSKEYFAQGFKIELPELQKILTYCWPLLPVGLAAVMNDAMTRQLLGWLVPGNITEKQNIMGEYNACVKFGVFISLFSQAFRYAAEPFFFKHMHTQNAKADYSKITTYFTMFTMLGFVAILFFLDYFKSYVIKNPAYLNAVGVVPVVLLANVFLGIYYNVSNWYRLTDKTRYGMYSALIGVGLTILFNILLVPRFGAMGTAWSMLICYFGMTAITYWWGQKYYPVPFELTKILMAILGGILIYYLSNVLNDRFHTSLLTKFILNTVLFIVYLIVFQWPMVKLVFVNENKIEKD